MTHTLQGDSEEEDSGSEENPQALSAEEAAEKERKKAGLPEINVDTVNSSIATKMLPLSRNK